MSQPVFHGNVGIFFHVFPATGGWRSIHSEDWAPLLPEEGRVQAPTVHFFPLRATVSTSLTTSVCENKHGAQGPTHCVGFIDTGAAGSSYNLAINWERKLPRVTTLLQVWDSFLTRDMNFIKTGNDLGLSGADLLKPRDLNPHPHKVLRIQIFKNQEYGKYKIKPSVIVTAEKVCMLLTNVGYKNSNMLWSGWGQDYIGTQTPTQSHTHKTCTGS